MESSSDTFIHTKASLLKKTPHDFKIVTYESHKVKNRKPTEHAVTEKIKTNNMRKEFNIRQAKQDVVKFSMAGSDNISEAKMQLAIKLGAKPPKNKYKNYKLLQADKKQQKENETKKMSFQQLGKNSIGKSNAKGKSFDRKRRKEKGDILSIYGKVKVASKS